MENFIEYLMYALLGHHYIVEKNEPNCIGLVSWTILLGGQVYFCLDQHDLSLLKYIRYNYVQDEETKARFDKLFSLCV